MRIPTFTFVIAALTATSLMAEQSNTPLTADEKREQYRQTKARGVSLRRESAVRRFAYAEKCEAAFEASEPMPEEDFYIKEKIGIDDDLMGMTFDEILEESGLANDAERESQLAVNKCIRKFRNRDSGS